MNSDANRAVHLSTGPIVNSQWLTKPHRFH